MANLFNKLNGGRNFKLFYHFKCFFILIFPSWIYRKRLAKTVASLESRGDKEYILERVDYYCKLLKLNKLRHFVFVEDKVAFSDKKDCAIFRGAIWGKPARMKLFEQYFGHKLCDLGATSKTKKYPAEWQKKSISIYAQLRYKFIFAIEGNDVASNLKWIMSSNSVAVMPEPTYETWFMEGKLLPDYHYIRIKKDYSDLPDRLQYYIEHPAEAEAIAKNAQEFVAQFFDNEREKLISLLVINKYFKEV